MNKNIFENKYLQKKVENINNDEEIKLPAYFKEQFLKHEYTDKAAVALEKDNFKISMSYHSLNLETYSQEEKQKNQKIFNTIKYKVFRSGENVLDEELSRHIKVLEALSFNKKNTSYDIYEILPKDYKIMFLPSLGEVGSFISVIDIEEKIIFIDGDILTPRGLLSLAHEVGHFQDFSKLSDRDFKISVLSASLLRTSVDYLVDFSKDDIENISENTLRRERNAWAFALHDLRHFFDDLGIKQKDVYTYIHKSSLKTYSDSINEIIDKKESNK